MNINPPFAISIITLIAFICIAILLKPEKRYKSVLLILLGGLLIEFKVYAGVILLFALLFLSIEEIAFKRNFSWIKLSIPIFIISLLLFFHQGFATVSLIEFKPFWLIHSMVDIADRLGWTRLSLARQAYFSQGIWVKYTLTELLGFVIFVVGNLGTRIIGLPYAIKVWKGELLRMGRFCLMFWMSIIAFLLPLVFVQKGNPWNTIQFFYYFLFFSSLFAGCVFFILWKKNILGKVVVVLGLLITPISSIPTFRNGFYPNPPAKVTVDELEALNFLSENEGIVITNPFTPTLKDNYQTPYPIYAYESTSYISAFTGRQVYLADVMQQEILGTEYKDRLSKSHSFFSNDSTDKKTFLEENNIRYVYLLKGYNINLGMYDFLDVVFENSEVVIYAFGK